MHTSIAMTEKEVESPLNNSNTEMNKGVELLLRNRRRKPKPKPTLQFKLSLFGREITFTLNITKK
tara:strand:- start:944 stop:1138 length:195 start_codon:yes stop_codon:yes gene_type:complete